VLLVVALSPGERPVAELLVKEDSGVGVAETTDVESDEVLSLLDTVVLSDDKAEPVSVEPDDEAEPVSVRPDDDSVTDALIVEESTADKLEVTPGLTDELETVALSELVEDDTVSEALEVTESSLAEEAVTFASTGDAVELT
jgi:hypothetical protein